MDIDFLKAADVLQEELRAFYRILQCGGNAEERQLATERLRAAVDRTEPLATDPGDSWQSLALDQQWGYLRVLSYLGTATHELKSVSKCG